MDASDLPPAERAKYYHRLAQDAAREAEKATGANRESYLIIAEKFKQLAKAADAETKSR
jgi:hypothetical protein